MIYEADRSYDFPIAGGRDASDDSFIVQVDLPTGTIELPIKKIPFQRTPKFAQAPELHCRVKSISPDGIPMLTLNISRYVYELYREAYAKNETFECEVRAVPDRPAEEPYTIVDRHGIFFRFNEPEGLLAKGQKLTCKFAKLTPQYFSITRIDQVARLQFFEPAAIVEGAGMGPREANFIMSFFMNRPEFEQARAELEAGRAVWLLTAANTVARCMPEWFLAGRLREQNRVYRHLLKCYTSILLYMLEGSAFLNAVPTEQRRALQQQLTDLVEGLEPYEFVLRLINRGEEDVFVEGLLDKLQRSGYIYHPARSFAVLMLIFRRHPNKVGNYLSRIFESIFGRDLDNWNREPFRSAFLEQFQIYVRQARSDIDALPLAESREAKNRIETIIIAIALQLLLANKDDDNSRALSMFYRYISLLRPVAAEQLLTKSFLSLLGVDLNSRLSYEELRQPSMMMTRATVLPAGDILERIEGSHRYVNSGLVFSITSEGMSLYRKDRPDITERAIPAGLMPWLSPQIFVNGVKGLSGTRLRRLSDHQTWWHSIENNLFEETELPETTASLRPAKGDVVYVVIDGVRDVFTRNPVFLCHVDHPDYERVSGYLPCDQIVDYIVPMPPENAWRSTSGRVRGFRARVLTDDNEGDDYRFSLRELADEYRDEVFNFTDEYTAKINAVTTRDYKALTEMGLGVSIERGPDVPELAVGDLIHFKLSPELNRTRGCGIFTGYVEDPYAAFTDNDAFENLMTAIGEEDESEDDTFDKLIRDIDEILTTEDVREIIELIRFRAIAESELVKAYDYLRFARLLALMIDDSRLAERLSAHASLLTMHQYFATNSRLDTDELAKVAADSLSDPFLSLLHRRLELVSWLGVPERNGELYDTVQSPSNELEGAIARMVLAYNMLQSSDDAETSVANDIKQKIMGKLNVNNETKAGKYYGTESKYVEFKTSLVYPAVGPGEKMRAAPEEQQYHILTRIAGLLNADGGHLYIGVNNEGYEVGMRDDFAYYARHRVRVKNHEHKITDLDKLTVFLEDLINSTFSQRIARKIEIFIDEEAGKGVIGIKVAQSLEPVYIDGHLYVRQSGQSTRECYGVALEEFIREREELTTEQRRRMRAEETAQAAETVADEAVKASEAQPQPTAEVSDLTAETDGTPVIATSMWRPNVLHQHEDGYAIPFGYLYFNEDNTVVFSSDDQYKETGDSGCRLALAIPHELAGQYLVLGFENEKALRVSIEELALAGENIPQRLADSEEKLIFAAAAHRDDALLCVCADSNDTLFMRGTRLAQIENGRINGQPRRLHEAPINRTVSYEIVDSSAIRGKIGDSMAEKVGNRRFGISMRVKTTAVDSAARVKNILDECAPAQY